MKDFLSEYGLIIVGAIVAIAVVSFIMWAIRDGGVLSDLSNSYADFIGGN